MANLRRKDELTEAQRVEIDAFMGIDRSGDDSSRTRRMPLVVRVSLGLLGDWKNVGAMAVRRWDDFVARTRSKPGQE